MHIGFKRKAEYEQHNMIFHRNLKRQSVPVDGPPAKVCKCSCNVTFPSYYRLMQYKHIDKGGHLMKQGRPKK